MKTTYYILQLLLTITLPIVSFSQSFTVKDKSDGSTLPFVRLAFNTGTSTFTDIDGLFEWPNDAEHVKIKYAGYRDTTVTLTQIKQSIIYLQTEAKEIDEVVILPGINPANRIIQNVIDNKKINHPLKGASFEYVSYNKFIVDADSNTLKTVNSKTESDTLTDEEKIIKRQHFFMLESATSRRFIPPAKDREEILAYKVSGINNPIFSTIAQSIQNFHFYEDEFSLLLKTYYSPLANDGLKRYYFILKDTTIIGTDTTFTITFQPRPGKEAETLKGTLYINTNGFAIEKVIAEPSIQKNFKVKVIQDYQFIDGKKWFPTNLSTYIDMGEDFSLGNKGRLIAKGNSYIQDIQIDPDAIKKNGFNNIAISTKESAGKIKEEEWLKYRKTELTEREQKTYEVLDSISKAENLDRKINTLGILLTGKIPIWKFSIPIDRFLDYNIQEGYRLGLGLETNKLMSENLTIGGYFAWGTKDKEWKYGGFASYDFYKPLGIKLTARYQEDRLQRGATILKNTPWDLTQPQFIANFYRRDLEKQRLAELQFTIAPLGNLTFHLIGNYQRIVLKDNYRYIEDGTPISSFDVMETALEVKWNIRQRILVLGQYRIAQPTKFPKITARFAKAIPGVFESQFDYFRTYVNILEELSSKRIGKLTLNLTFNQTFGAAPLTYQNVAVGSMDKFGIVTSTTMETIHPAEFYSQRQIMFLTRYDFPSIRTKVKFFKPQFALHHGLAFGDLHDRSVHELIDTKYPLQSMDKGVFEGGVILNNALNLSQFLHIGIGCFYRYGYYSNPVWHKNLVPKLAISFGF